MLTWSIVRKKLGCTLLWAAAATVAHGQPAGKSGVLKGRVIYTHSPYAPFPDTARYRGHLYEDQWFDPLLHYSDSTVLIYIPPGVSLLGKPDLVFWFHGWHNNVRHAFDYYHLGLQFLAARRNAILILVEAAKDAPDSYGGKLEQPGDFAALVQDLSKTLSLQGLAPAGLQPGHIMLAGHSGAFRVIAQILEKGGLPVDEVVLFDALYGYGPLFESWLALRPEHHLVNWYTDQGGGTDEESLAMMGRMRRRGEAFYFSEESQMQDSSLRASRAVFIHSPRAHNDIIFDPDNLERMLRQSPLLSAQARTSGHKK